MEATYIDESFPFTEGELVQAFALTQPLSQAQEMAAHVASVVREAVAGAAALREAREHGNSEAEEVEEPEWIVPEEAFAQLSFVSPELAARVEQFIQARWEPIRQDVVRGRMEAAGLQATTPPIEAEGDAVVDAIRAEWEGIREKVRAHVTRGSWSPL